MTSWMSTRVWNMLKIPATTLWRTCVNT
jgi:hypothetical protein